MRDDHDLDAARRKQGCNRLIERRFRIGLEACFAGVELHRLVRRGERGGDRGRDFIGTAIVVGDAVLGLGFVRARVARVGDAVFVVIVVGTAVVVLELVEVFGAVGALVDARSTMLVAVGIRLGAAVADRRSR